MLARAEAKEQLGEYRWRVFGYPRAFIKFVLMVSMASGQENNGALSLSSLHHAGLNLIYITHRGLGSNSDQKSKQEKGTGHPCKRIRMFGIKYS